MVVCAMALALSVLVFLTGRGLLWIVQSRVLTPDQLGGLFYANRMVAVSSTLLLPVYLFVVVYALERRKRVLS